MRLIDQSSLDDNLGTTAFIKPVHNKDASLLSFLNLVIIFKKGLQL